MSRPDRRSFLTSTAVLGGLAATATHADDPPSLTRPPRKFKLGTVTYNIAKDWDLPTLLDICRTTGLAAVEARTTHRHGIEPTLTVEQRRDVKRRFHDSGVVFWGCGSVCEFHAPDAEKVRQNIETCKEFVRLVADLGGTGVKVRPNGLPREVPVEKTLEQIGKALMECGRFAAEQGVEIWVEVHGSGTALPQHMKAIMEQCGHPAVGVTWNSNATDLIRGSITESFAMLRPWIRSCHINDLYNDEKGTYPYRLLFQLLRNMGYDRYTLIEVGRPMPDRASSEEFLRYYRALWNELSK